MMDKKLKRKWVKALRSGQYPQSGGNLKDKFGYYCCLGVLCDIQGAAWTQSKNKNREGSTPRIDGEIAHRNGEQYVRDKFAGGLSKAEQVNLASKNDLGRTFPEIADYIEETL